METRENTLSSDPGSLMMNPAQISNYNPHRTGFSYHGQYSTLPTSSELREATFYKIRQEQSQRQHRLHTDQKFFKITKQGMNKKQRLEVDAVEVESKFDRSFMERLGCQMSKKKQYLLLEAQGRATLKSTANQVRDLNTELFEITTKTENEKRVDPELLTQRLINNLQKNSYPLDQDELILIDKELQEEQKHNTVFKNTMTLKIRCEQKKDAFEKFCLKEKERQEQMKEIEQQVETDGRQDVQDAYYMYKMLENEYNKTKQFYKGGKTTQLKPQDERSNADLDNVGGDTTPISKKGKAPRTPPQIVLQETTTGISPIKTISMKQEGGARQPNDSKMIFNSQHSSELGEINTHRSSKLMDKSVQSKRSKTTDQIRKERRARTIQFAKEKFGQTAMSQEQDTQNPLRHSNQTPLNINLLSSGSAIGTRNTNNSSSLSSNINLKNNLQESLKNKKKLEPILYTKASMQQLIQNDSAKYENSRKEVIDEYFQLSRDSFWILKQKIKV